MRRLPNFTALRAFEAAARLESFAAAAEELHQTPSAISHQIRGLETYFGKPMFIRYSRHIEVTTDGKRLLNTLSTAFDDIEQACHDIRPVTDTLDLAVHCSPSFATKWLSPRLADLMRQPTPLNIRLSSSALPLDLLRHEEIDIAISYGTAIQRKGIRVEALGQETLAPLASPRLLGAGGALSLEALEGYTLIESDLSPIHWQDFFSLNGRKLAGEKPRPSFDRAYLAISAAVDGLGIALESTRLAHRELSTGELVQVEGADFQAIRREIHFLCYRESQQHSLKLRRFRAWISGQVAADEG